MFSVSRSVPNVSKCNQCYQEFSTDMTLRNIFFGVFFYSVCPRSGVPTVLYASSVLGPNSRFGIRIRSIVFPCTFSIALTSVYTYNLNTAAVSTSYEKCIICLESPPKNLISKCVFYWLKHGGASKPCVSASSSAGKKAQNWGFEITNVRYGHQPAFCRHFNDGSNSCFQTTNWNAAQAGYRQAFWKLWINVSINFSATSTTLVLNYFNHQFPSNWTGLGACTNFEVQIFPEWVFNQLLSFERCRLKYWEIKSGFCAAKTFTKSKWWISKQLF